MADAKAKAEALIQKNAVMVFSKTYCPHCYHSKEILRQKQEEYEAKGTPFTMEFYELDLDKAGGDAIQDYLGERSKARTVPRIFIAGETLGGQTYGGRDDLDASMKNGAKKPLDSHWLKMAVEYTAAHST